MSSLTPPISCSLLSDNRFFTPLQKYRTWFIPCIFKKNHTCYFLCLNKCIPLIITHGMSCQTFRGCLKVTYIRGLAQLCYYCLDIAAVPSALAFILLISLYSILLLCLRLPLSLSLFRLWASGGQLCPNASWYPQCPAQCHEKSDPGKYLLMNGWFVCTEKGRRHGKLPFFFWYYKHKLTS